MGGLQPGERLLVLYYLMDFFNKDYDSRKA
jgi:hypothetical protein